VLISVVPISSVVVSGIHWNAVCEDYSAHMTVQTWLMIEGGSQLIIGLSTLVFFWLSFSYNVSSTPTWALAALGTAFQLAWLAFGAVILARTIGCLSNESTRSLMMCSIAAECWGAVLAMVTLACGFCCFDFSNFTLNRGNTTLADDYTSTPTYQTEDHHPVSVTRYGAIANGHSHGNELTNGATQA